MCYAPRDPRPFTWCQPAQPAVRAWSLIRHSFLSTLCGSLNPPYQFSYVACCRSARRVSTSFLSYLQLPGAGWSRIVTVRSADRATASLTALNSLLLTYSVVTHISSMSAVKRSRSLKGFSALFLLLHEQRPSCSFLLFLCKISSYCQDRVASAAYLALIEFDQYLRRIVIHSFAPSFRAWLGDVLCRSSLLGAEFLDLGGTDFPCPRCTAHQHVIFRASEKPPAEGATGHLLLPHLPPHPHNQNERSAYLQSNRCLALSFLFCSLLGHSILRGGRPQSSRRPPRHGMCPAQAASSLPHRSANLHLGATRPSSLRDARRAAPFSLLACPRWLVSPTFHVTCLLYAMSLLVGVHQCLRFVALQPDFFSSAMASLSPSSQLQHDMKLTLDSLFSSGQRTTLRPVVRRTTPQPRPLSRALIHENRKQ